VVSSPTTAYIYPPGRGRVGLRKLHECDVIIQIFAPSEGKRDAKKGRPQTLKRGVGKEGWVESDIKGIYKLG